MLFTANQEQLHAVREFLVLNSYFLRRDNYKQKNYYKNFVFRFLCSQKFELINKQEMHFILIKQC